MLCLWVSLLKIVLVSIKIFRRKQRAFLSYLMGKSFERYAMISAKLFKCEVEMSKDDFLTLLRSNKEVSFYQDGNDIKVCGGRHKDGLTLPIQLGAKAAFLRTFDNVWGSELIYLKPLVLPLKIAGYDNYAGFMAYYLGESFRSQGGEGEMFTPYYHAVFPNNVATDIEG